MAGCVRCGRAQESPQRNSATKQHRLKGSLLLSQKNPNQQNKRKPQACRVSLRAASVCFSDSMEMSIYLHLSVSSHTHLDLVLSVCLCSLWVILQASVQHFPMYFQPVVETENSFKALHVVLEGGWPTPTHTHTHTSTSSISFPHYTQAWTERKGSGQPHSFFLHS